MRRCKIQTFLPVADFNESIKCLDKKRLFKQALEARELCQILKNKKESRWKNHPACMMWKGYEDALIAYYNTCLSYCFKIGIKTKLEFIQVNDNCSIEDPWWFGKEQFHRSHRIALLTKNFEHYKQFGWKEQQDPNYKYFWPVIKCFHCKGMGVVLDEDGGVQCPYCHGTKIMNNAIIAFDVVIESPIINKIWL